MMKFERLINLLIIPFWINTLSGIVSGGISYWIAKNTFQQPLVNASVISILTIFITLSVIYFIKHSRDGENQQISTSSSTLPLTNQVQNSPISSGAVIQNNFGNIQFGPSESIDYQKVGKGISQNEPAYRVLLGQRHKLLREKYLKINPREMADFYGYQEVATLEGYEVGNKEFPVSDINRFVETFFISRKYLENGDTPIFNNCSVCNRDQLSLLFNDGFQLLFLCHPKPREELYTYPIFYKEERNYTRLVVATQSSFSSSGGGKSNIIDIIEEMIKHRVRPNAIFSTARLAEWEAVNRGIFYCRDIITIVAMSGDFECRDIFFEWFDEQLRIHKENST